MERAARAAAAALPVAALVLAAAVYFRDLLPLPEVTRYFGSDFASYFYPVYRYVAEEVGAGRLPHWTPFVGVGYPLLADIEACVFYPPIRLLTALTGPPSYLTLELYAMAHFVVTGLGMLALGRWLGLSVPAAATGAFVGMFSGFLWAHAAHLTIVQAVAWLPWLLLAHARAQAARSAGWAVTAGVLFALLTLGGHPQIAFYAGLALGLHALVLLDEAWSAVGWQRRVAIPVITVAAVGLGLALAAPQLAPTLSLAPATSRWDPSPDFLGLDALTVDHLLPFLIPLAYFGTDRFQSVDEFFAYVGIGALLLASAGVVLRRDAWSRYFGLLVVVGLALGFAPHLPGFQTTAPQLPLIGVFRASARATLLTDLGLAGLAALGLEAWGRRLHTGEVRERIRALVWSWRIATGLALAGGAVVALGRIPDWIGPLADQFPEFYAYFVVILVAHVAVLEAWRAGWLPASLGALATVALVLTNLTFPHRALAWTLSSPEAAWLGGDIAGRLTTEPGRERVWNEGWLHRRGGTFEDNAGLFHRIEVVSHYTSLPLTRFDEFSRAIGDPWQESALVDLLNVRHLVLSEGDTRPYRHGLYSPPHLDAGDDRRYDLRGLLEEPIGEVTLVADPDPPSMSAGTASVVVTSGARLDICLGCPASGTEPAGSVTTDSGALIASVALAPRRPADRVRLRNRLPFAVSVRELRLDEVDLYGLGGRYRQLGPNLWENGHVLPRAFLVEEVLILPDTGLIVPTLLTMDPRRTAIVETRPVCHPRLRPAEALPPEVEVLEYGASRVRLRTRHSRPAFLVLTDAHFKEWRARVDGQRTGTHHVDLVFRGVCVPAGEHEVEFRYHAFALERGLAIAAVGALAALGAVLGPGWWRRRRSR